MTDTDVSDQNAARAAARQYAWRWFEYHAGQRQSVFRFFLLFSGAIATGYFSSITTTQLSHLAYLFGIGLAVTATLFWRLDVRSLKLVKLAESYLKVDEETLATALGTEAVLLASKADSERPTGAVVRRFYSFRQIYKLIFALVGAVGILIFLLDASSPIGRLLGRYPPCT